MVSDQDEINREFAERLASTEQESITLRRDVDHINRNFDRLIDEVDQIKRALWIVAGAVAVSAVPSLGKLVLEFMKV